MNTRAVRRVGYEDDLYMVIETVVPGDDKHHITEFKVSLSQSDVSAVVDNVYFQRLLTHAAVTQDIDQHHLYAVTSIARLCVRSPEPDEMYTVIFKVKLTMEVPCKLRAY